MTCPTRVRYLPGDFVYVEDLDSYALIVCVIKGQGGVFYRAFTKYEYRFEKKQHDNDWDHRAKYFEPNRPGYNHSLKIINRIFFPQRNYICQEDGCTVKNIIGECLDCPHKIDYSKEGANIFLPGDTVWCPVEKRLAEVEAMCLRVPESPRYPNSYITISPWSSWGHNLLTDNFSIVAGEPAISIDQFYGFILENPDMPPGITYYEKSWKGNLGMAKIPVNAKMRNQSKIAYFVPEDAESICSACIYQGSYDCVGCKTRELLEI